jgi:hypothetical protein
MPLKLTRPRQKIQQYLMPDTCTLVDAGAAVQSDTGGQTPGAARRRTVACGFIDLRRSTAEEALREAVQVGPRGSYRFRLPLGTVVASTTLIEFAGRRYEVVDPGAPAHGLSLATYVGVEEL